MGLGRSQQGSQEGLEVEHCTGAVLKTVPLHWVVVPVVLGNLAVGWKGGVSGSSGAVVGW